VNLEIRYAQLEDAVPLKKWLLDPTILRWFPMIDEREVDDSIRIWMSYVPLKAGFTATIDGEPVGMANLYIHPFKKLAHQTLFSIVVDEKHRGKGVGRALLAHIAKVAKDQHKIELLHLEVYDGNPARRLYEREGFKMYGRHKKFIKIGNEYIDKIFMQKRL